MTGIAVRPSGPDRPRRALEILAQHGEQTTPQIVEAAGELGRKSAMSWYGNNLRKAEKRGWVVRTGQEHGGWQQGRPVRWMITEAGQKRLAEYEAARSTPTTRQATAARKEKSLEQWKVRQAVLSGAEVLIAPGILSDDGKLKLAVQLRDAGCTLAEIGDLFGKSREWVRLVLKFGTWHVTAQMISSRRAADEHTRLSQEIEEIVNGPWPEEGTE